MKLPRIPHLLFLAVPMFIFIAGLASNQLVMIANGGQMPVLFPSGTCPDLSEDAIHTCMTAASHLKFLADIFNMHAYIESIGDVLLDVGSYLMGPAFFTWCILMIKDRQ